MTEQDWIILRLLQASTPEFIRLTNHAQRDYTKAFVYLVNKYGPDLILDSIDQLKGEVNETN
jgi:hypothetical protein